MDATRLGDGDGLPLWLFEHMPTALLVHQTAERTVRCNRLARELLGLAEVQVPEDALLNPAWALLCEDGAVLSREASPIRRVAQTRAPLRDVVYGIRRPDGPVVWVAVSAEPVFDAEGRVAQTVVTFADITERRRAEDRSALLGFALDRMSDTVLLMGDNDPHFLYVNDGAVQSLGYSREQLIGGMGVFDIDPGWSPTRWQEFWPEFVARQRINIDTTQRARDGRLVPVEVNANLFEFRGQVYNFAICRDISERLRNQAALRSEKERFRTVFEHAPVSILEENLEAIAASFDALRANGVQDLRAYIGSNPDFVLQCASQLLIVDANPAALTLHGAADKDQLRACHAVCSTAEERQAFERKLLDLWSGGVEFHGDGVIRTVNGEWRDVTRHLVVCPGFEKTLGKVLVSQVDITERKRLAASERMRADALVMLARGEPLADILTAIVRSIEGERPGLWASVTQLDAGDGRSRLHVAPSLPAAFSEAANGPADGALAGLARERIVIADIARHCGATPYGKVAAQAGIAACCAQPLLGRDGVVIGALALYSGKQGVFDAGDLALMDVANGLIGVVVDHQRAQDEVRRLNADLERRVRERTAELEVARDAAQAANLAKSQFLATMSHEIRTPMNAIVGLSHLALQGQLEPQQRDYVQKVSASAHSLLGIINDILDFSKMEAHKLDLESIDFDLADLMGELADMVGLKAEEKGLELVFSLPVDMPTRLVGDPLRLRQVLLNLCNNAVKFTERGTVLLDLEPIRIDADAMRIRFSVRDTGIGLSQEQITRLFMPFSQADASTSRRHGGTGLGLAICRQLVQLMGGEIGVRSMPGRGSDFHFELRLALQSGAVGPAMALRFDKRAIRALLVDDNPLTLECLARTLRAIGIEVVTASNVSEAVERAERARAEGGRHDVLLIDWGMPEMAGAECVRRIGAALGGAPVPVVPLIRAYCHRLMAQGMLDESAPLESCLSKPVLPSTLVDALSKALHLQGRVAPGASRKGVKQVDWMSVLSGSKVLVVEDNAVNRDVALGLLSAVGVAVSFAFNGREALAALDRERFDAVLMDGQMPEMDGYQASREIRRRPGLQRLPVIAMTANAMAGDRAKALEAGMSDHVAKPINVEELYSTLARWLAAAPAATKEGLDAELPNNASAFDLPPMEGIDAQAALASTDGNAALCRRVLRMFRLAQGDTLDRARTAREAGDSATVARLLHELQGLAGTLGMTALRGSALALEAAWSRPASQEETDRCWRAAELDLAVVTSSLVALGDKD